MLLHELSCHKVRLLLSVLMLKDACRNHYTIPSVDPIVSDEPRYFADEGHEALIHKPPRFARVGHTLLSAHCNVHSFTLPPKEGAGPVGPAVLRNVAKYAELQGLAQLRRIPLLGTWVNTARTRRAQRTDVPHDDLKEALIRRPDGVYVTMPFQTHQRNVVGGCWERTETRTRPRTGRSGCCLQTTTPCSGRALRGYWAPTGAWRS